MEAKPTDGERWQTEIEFRREELRLKEREVLIKETEQVRLANEARRSRWWNPLFIAIIGATIAAIGSAFVSWWNGRVSEQTENFKAESARIIEMIHSRDFKDIRNNLQFLLEAGLITGETADNVRSYLLTTNDKQLPRLAPPDRSLNGPAENSVF